jgi:hypothetical protein
MEQQEGGKSEDNSTWPEGLLPPARQGSIERGWSPRGSSSPNGAFFWWLALTGREVFRRLGKIPNHGDSAKFQAGADECLPEEGSSARS